MNSMTGWFGTSREGKASFPKTKKTFAVEIAVALALLASCLASRGQTLGEALNATNLTWTTGGDTNWFGQTAIAHDGIAAAQSGQVTRFQEAWIETTVTGPGVLSFWWKMTPPAPGAYLLFTINGDFQDVISDQVSWQQKAYYDLPAGTHTLRWSIKNQNEFPADDQSAGWLDQVSFGPGTAPEITSGPIGGTVDDGSNFTFTVSVTGIPLPVYQWRFAGAPISGANDSSLPLTYVQPSQSGWYDVVVSNSTASITSAPALLTVNGTAPEITSQPYGGTFYGGDNFTLTVTASGIRFPSFQWRFAGVPIPGASAASLPLTNLQPTQSGWYDVVASNGTGSITSAPALLTVYVPPPLSEPVLDMQHGLAGLELVIRADSQPSALMLYTTTNLNDFAAAELAFMTNMPQSGELRLPLMAEVASRFFRAERLHGDVLDYTWPDFPEPSEVDLSVWTLGLPDPLDSGVTYTADFLLFQSDTNLADFNGTASLAVVRLEDGGLHPDGVVSPNLIYFNQGACRTQITVTASSSLSGYRVAVVLSLDQPAQSLQGDSPINPSSSTTLTNTPILAFPNSPPDQATAHILALEGVQAIRDADESYSNPLPAPLPEVAGTFGEWRGHKRNGRNHANSHAGLDLVAGAGTRVNASRGGIVTAVGTASGRYVTISHLDGWYSQYLHLATTGAPPAIGSYKQRGDQVGVVGPRSQTRMAEHLHFELRRANNLGLSVGFPGNGRDPLQQPGIFAVRFPSQRAVVKDVGVTPLKPTTHNYVAPSQPVSGGTNEVFVVLQVVHPELRPVEGGDPRKLSPRAISFQSESNNTPLLLTTTNETQIAALKPARQPTNYGFAIYQHGTTTNADYTKAYKYWFRWDVSSYAGSSNGPRTFSVVTTNYAGLEKTNAMKWGPQILSVKPVGAPTDGEQRHRFRVRVWRGEAADTAPESLATGDWAVGTDWLRYELPPGGRWVQGNTTVLDESAAALGNQRFRTNDFYWPVNSPGITNPLVAVRSRTVPAIAHAAAILDMVLIPAGSFTMGNAMGTNDGWSHELPLHLVFVSAFFMDKHSVTKALWDEVFAWAITNGYSFDHADSGQGKAANHPVHSVTWYDMVKWCNARSEREGRTPAYYTSAVHTNVYRTGQQTDLANDFVNWNAGYRLPTEAEWEKAARGGASGLRFPWGNTITHSHANYFSSTTFGTYDTSPTRGYHPSYNDNVFPLTNTSPVGSFAANGYGLYDMAGNVWAWCWDWFGASYYSESPISDPQGPATGSNRVLRGGGWPNHAISCRVADRNFNGSFPASRGKDIGFRTVLPPDPQ